MVSEEVTASASAFRVQVTEIGLGGLCSADQDDPALGLLARTAGAAHRVDEPGSAQPGLFVLPLVGLVVDDDGPYRQVDPVGEGGGAGEIGQCVVADGLLEGFQDLDGQAAWWNPTPCGRTVTSGWSSPSCRSTKSTSGARAGCSLSSSARPCASC